MKRLILLIALVVILAGLPLLVGSETSTTLTDSSIPDDEITTGHTQASNSSTRGATTITMYAVIGE